jgi:hypothetical protein
LKYDVIHDTLNLDYDKKLKRPRDFGDIGFFGDMGISLKCKLKSCEIAEVFSAILANA